MAKSAHPSPKLHLNLLYPQNQTQKLPVKFIKWLISYGRYIVVIVEIVVIGSFVMRFKLDADIASLKEEINSKVPYIESKAADEALIRHTQQRLSTLKKISGQSPQWQSLMTKISSKIPSSTYLNSLSWAHAPTGAAMQFKLTARASSNTDLATMLHGLKKDTSLKDITLASITYDEGQIVFTITGATK